MSLSHFTYGGQACTVINSIDEPDNQAMATIYGVTAYCPETSIVSATDNIISYTVSEDPIPTHPVMCASKFFAGINQASPVQESGVSATASGASVATPALTTTNPGVAFVLGCAVDNGVYSPGAGWTLQVDTPEDADPSMRLLIADRATDGTHVIPSATFDSEQADNATQIVAVGVSFNGGGGEGAIGRRTQTASKPQSPLVYLAD